MLTLFGPDQVDLAHQVVGRPVLEHVGDVIVEKKHRLGLGKRGRIRRGGEDLLHLGVRITVFVENLVAALLEEVQILPQPGVVGLQL
jgi:hypothetical protein